KIWRPKTIRGFGGAAVEPVGVPIANSPETGSAGEVFLAWAPYIVLILVVVAWTGPWSKLPAISAFKLSIARKASVTQKPITSIFNFTPLSGGTSILVSWLVILAILRPGSATLRKVFSRTFKQMWGALLVAFFIFALAYVFVYTGMANSLAYGFSKM